MALNLFDFKIVTLTDDINIDIDCENDDLNDFFKKDALNYQNELTTKTYCVMDNNKIVAMYSLLHDNIELTSNVKRKLFKRSKHFKCYPAVKPGRLGVDKQYKKMVSVVKFLIF